ncbi:hypothetical protein AXG93_3756s1310 [Marchantia polymorpha subsp. ruderalis]|uniref:Uncharacterized protein n=1 Tax=Marchantia polymorpha subsp. ruderalis TaxID=1480154 RepID=A0A176VI74_MARPO|nr:hypothetical protein AXG93_3756s1310 [Marchantia polymorpha subsp. ruderalis]
MTNRSKGCQSCPVKGLRSDVVDLTAEGRRSVRSFYLCVGWLEILETKKRIASMQVTQSPPHAQSSCWCDPGFCGQAFEKRREEKRREGKGRERKVWLVCLPAPSPGTLYFFWGMESNKRTAALHGRAEQSSYEPPGKYIFDMPDKALQRKIKENLAILSLFSRINCASDVHGSLGDERRKVLCSALFRVYGGEMAGRQAGSEAVRTRVVVVELLAQMDSTSELPQTGRGNNPKARKVAPAVKVQSSHRRRTGREEKSREVRAPWFMALNRSQLDFTGDGFVMADMTQLSSAVRTQFIQSLRCLSSKSGLPMPMPQPMPDAAAARLESAIHDEAALTERRRLESSVSDHPPQISARTSTRLRELEAQSRE